MTDRCDLRCTYCTPYRRSITRVDSCLSLSEISLLVSAFARNGVTKVRLTGGEPLVRRDLVEIVRTVAGTPGIACVGLTTNGTKLQSIAHDLARAGLGLVNISLDSLNRETYQRITGRDALHDVLAGIDSAMACGFQKVKINTVVMRGVNDSELSDIAHLARDRPVEVRFIELMPLGYSGEEWRALHVPAAEIREALGGLKTSSSEPGASARCYKMPGWKGRLGIISPMTEQFCEGCNRMRVTAAGRLKPCLRLPVEEDIRPLLREPDLVKRLGMLMDRLSCHKLPAYSAPESAVQAEAMCLLGG
ncbi:MAG: GTP 3',8-cyclase MoaA [Armatimonadetes bacterium]|nr:GTP 3',8-cyclase MoaA [Armatimonadota bacterium]